MDRCVNCGIISTISRNGKHVIKDEAVLGIINRWRAPQQVNKNQILCQACWNLATDAVFNENKTKSIPAVGHSRVCINCGRSVLRTQSHRLRTHPKRELHIYNVIRQRIQPRRIEDQSLICHPCWIRADRAARATVQSATNPSATTTKLGISLEQDDITGDSSARTENETSQVPTIVLPSFFRACETQRKCFIEGCKPRERNRINLSLRKLLLTMYNYYIPPNNRLCNYHMTTTSWDFLYGIRENYCNTFTATQIEDLISLKDITRPATVIDCSEQQLDQPAASGEGAQADPLTIDLKTVPIPFEETSKTEVLSEVKNEVPETSDTAENLDLTSIDAEETPSQTEKLMENGDWQQRESELLKKIEELEKLRNERSEEGLALQLKMCQEENALLKARNKNLETQLQATLAKPGTTNHELIESIKQQHEELLMKARGMIFDKTKIVKNQDLQIEALTSQVESLKDINLITKDLLEIRNSEIKAMEDRLAAMEARFKAEKDRYGLVLQRAQTSSTLNDDLKKEYETQLAIFKELRDKYEQRVQALVAENATLKQTLVVLKGTTGTGTGAT